VGKADARWAADRAVVGPLVVRVVRDVGAPEHEVGEPELHPPRALWREVGQLVEQEALPQLREPLELLQVGEDCATALPSAPYRARPGAPAGLSVARGRKVSGVASTRVTHESPRRRG
jgi:hypothetical protein